MTRKVTHCFFEVVGEDVPVGAGLGSAVGTSEAWQVTRCESTGSAAEVGNAVVEAEGGAIMMGAEVPLASSVMSSSSCCSFSI